MDLLRHSGRAVCLYCTAPKTKLTTIEPEDLFLTSYFPDFTSNPLVDLLTTHYERIILRIRLKLLCRRSPQTYDLYGPVRNAFDAGKSIVRARA
jgi:hypothetical protein